MTAQHIGILHPGQMGISIAASAQKSGAIVCWASEGRSDNTRLRAEHFGLRDVQSISALCAECSVIISVCPPDAAEAVADQVAASGFRGLYLDANAISPARARRIGERVVQAGASFVDGGIIGGPAWEPGETWLYLTGPQADEVAACFSAGPLATRVLGGAIGRASALKMCYSAYTKGTTALLAAILAVAENLDVRDELYEQWNRDDPGFSIQVERRVDKAAPKAWRFAGEMDQIAATFREVGMPGDFHAAAGDIYRRLVRFKDSAEPPPVEDLLAALQAGYPSA